MTTELEEVSGERLVGKVLKIVEIRYVRESEKGKVRDFCLNVICKLVAKALQVDKLPEALETEGEEKKGQKCLGETRRVK